MCGILEIMDAYVDLVSFYLIIQSEYLFPSELHILRKSDLFCSFVTAHIN